MCQAKTAVDMLKQHKSLTKGEIIMVFEKVIEDQKATNQSIREIKDDVATMKLDIAVVKTEFSEMKDLLVRALKKPTLWDRIPILKELPLPAWVFLIIVACAIASLLGADLSFMSSWLKFGGQ